VSIANVLRNLAGFRKRTDGQAPDPLRLKRPRRRADRIGADGEPRFRMLASDRSDDHITPQVREAFTPTQPVMTRSLLAGRLDPLRQLIEAVEDHRSHIVLYGERGIGKTSLLGVFANLARDAEYLVIRENCGADTTFDELFRTISAQIPLLYYGGFAPSEAQSRAGGTIADLLSDSQVGPNQLSRIWSEIIGTRVLVILDEFDRTEQPDFDRDVVELIKNLSDSAARVQLVIAGVSRTLRTLFGHSPSIRRNITGIPLLPMDDFEVAQLVELGERHAGLVFDPAAKARIIGLAHGRPHLARLIAHHASLRAVASGRKAVGLSDVDHSIVLALNDMETRFSESTVEAAQSLLKKRPDLVASVARASLRHGGTFAVEEVVCDGLAGENLERFISGSSTLIAPAENLSRRYSFVEEGLPAYLMLAANLTRSAA